ncbi:MAG: ATP-dependent DNA helicase RecG [bacterium]|nr:ATP-dependent DNA helicase RecG [bacterium]
MTGEQLQPARPDRPAAPAAVATLARPPFLDDELTWLKGVGPRKAEVLARHGLRIVEDLLHFYPRRYLDRTSVTRIADLRTEMGEITVVGRLLTVQVKGFAKGQRCEAVLADGSGRMTLVWFNRVAWVQKFLQAGDVIAASAKPSFYRGWQFQHPAVEKLAIDETEVDPDAPSQAPEDLNYQGQVVPIYPGSEELRRAWLDSRALSRIIRGLFQRHRVEPADPLPPALRRRFGLVDLASALREVHLGRSMEDVERARHRLKFEEFFLLELMLAWRKATIGRAEKGLQFDRDSGLVDRLLDSLPFRLTAGQRRAVDEIFRDMRSPHPMNRLLQGDVGCGKTLVALCAMLLCVDNGHQAALMAPTEILAEQHARTLIRLAEPLGLRVALLTGSRLAAARRRALQETASGLAHLVVGTHALIQDEVAFADLGLAIIDEQHRFGVEQRARLRRKAPVLDTLVMTATPIPRTLAIVGYGDMDLSVIRELPPGRLPVTTVWRRENKRPEIFRFVREQVDKGAQAYVVYPLVEESEKLDLRAAEEACAELQADWLAGLPVGLLHGRMKAAEKEAVMRSFLEGGLRVLVSTTVIEVGVDNPRATIMVVEQAERFGLAQLHQLRGRVGRGADKSWCVLVAGKALSNEGRERLETMAATQDGFVIAEADLRMRGTGDFFGTRQSGLPEFRIADLLRDTELLIQARDAAFQLVEEDPGLSQAPVLREHLHTTYADRLARVED